MEVRHHNGEQFYYFHVRFLINLQYKFPWNFVEVFPRLVPGQDGLDQQQQLGEALIGAHQFIPEILGQQSFHVFIYFDRLGPLVKVFT